VAVCRGSGKRKKKSLKSIYQFDTATVATLEGLSLYTRNETFPPPFHTQALIYKHILLHRNLVSSKTATEGDYYAERATKDLMNHEVGKKDI